MKNYLNKTGIVRTDYEHLILTKSWIIDDPQEINISTLFLDGKYIELHIASTEKNRDINFDQVIFKQPGTIYNDSDRMLSIKTVIVDYGNGFSQWLNIPVGYILNNVCYDPLCDENIVVIGHYIGN